MPSSPSPLGLAAKSVPSHLMASTSSQQGNLEGIITILIKLAMAPHCLQTKATAHHTMMLGPWYPPQTTFQATLTHTD